MYGLQPHQLTPSLKRFSSNFDEPFSDVVSAFEHPLNSDMQEGEKTVDRNHQLLSFGFPTLEYALLDYNFNQAPMTLAAQLHGMFFLAESPWTHNGNNTQQHANPPAELTCYRRNLFQITGTVTLPRALRYIMTSEGKQIPVLSQELVVSAIESTEGNAVKVISVPWKTPANANPPSDDKVEKEPPTIPLDMSSIQDMDSEYASFPFQWKRLQFRIATANNGRRKELQQHFRLQLKVMATLATGGKASIATAQSGAIIVRGRSPRNFSSRKDTPLTGLGNHARRSSGLPGHLNRLNSGDSASAVGNPRQQLKTDLTSAPIKAEIPPPPMSVTSFYEPPEFHMSSVPAGLFDNTFLPDPHQQAQQGAQQAHQGAMTALPQDFATPDNIAAVNTRGYPLSSPDLSRPTPAAAAQQAALPTVTAPTKLSLVDEETPKAISLSPRANRHSPLMGQSNHNHPSSSSHPSKRQAIMPPPSSTNHRRIPSTFSLNVVSSPDESADLLYEYFPLSLDDWMPPVDAVYRPHVVHHIKPLAPAPEGLKTGPGGVVGKAGVGGGFGGWGSRSKRYFSEDVG